MLVPKAAVQDRHTHAALDASPVAAISHGSSRRPWPRRDLHANRRDPPDGLGGHSVNLARRKPR
jgi:hypothetical protein